MIDRTAMEVLLTQRLAEAEADRDQFARRLAAVGALLEGWRDILRQLYLVDERFETLESCADELGARLEE